MADAKVARSLFELQRSAYRAAIIAAMINGCMAIYNVFAVHRALQHASAREAAIYSTLATASVIFTVWMTFNARSARNRMRETAVKALSDGG